ncbi:MAG: zinc ABC transporter substrate-binding protein [Candidatus Staskawiczbacteria bacterium]|nr:zinc ABC transporter substrate-binding protein [Candidatus Staskawiczbacteria bacterium]
MDKKSKIIIFFIIGFIFIGFLVIILNNIYNYQVQPDKIQVSASFYPLYFFARQIGGDKANVINITPAGAEPHDYEPTAKDIAQIENSKLVVLIGEGFEPWGSNIKQNLDSKNTIILTVGEENNTTDPHIWLNPQLAKEIVDKITNGFAQIDPENTGYYQTNADIFKNELNNLDVEYKQGLADCEEKNIITSHSAFGYLAADYGFNQVSIAGLSPDAEPSSQQLANIVNFAKENNVKYIFFESLVSPKLSDTIANEVGAKTMVLNPIEGLTNEEVSQGKSYFTEMRNNLDNLKIALKCK